jgi:hypothetical protein
MSATPDGRIIVAGYAEDATMRQQPAVWEETSPGGGEFELHLLPLMLGMTTGEANALLGDDPLAQLRVVGTATTAVGTTRGMLWLTDDLSTWETCDLSPLAEFGSSNSLSFGSIVPDMFVLLSGASYPTGGDPLTSGRATLWTVDLSGDTPGVTNVIDVNDLTVGLPPGCTATKIATGYFDADPVVGMPPLLVVFACPGGRAARDTLPHAAVLFAQPQQAIPAVTTWGMVAMTLLVLTAATLVYTRRRPAHLRQRGAFH